MLGMVQKKNCIKIHLSHVAFEPAAYLAYGFYANVLEESSLKATSIPGRFPHLEAGPSERNGPEIVVGLEDDSNSHLQHLVFSLLLMKSVVLLCLVLSILP